MSGKTILWIEDDIDVLDPVIRPLTRDGSFTVVECRTYAQALTHIQDIHTFDLILLDLLLPPGNSNDQSEYLGLQFLRRLRQEFAIQTPVIVFSVIAAIPDVAQELETLGAVFLTKPIRPSKLRAKIYELLGLPIG